MSPTPVSVTRIYLVQLCFLSWIPCSDVVTYELDSDQTTTPFARVATSLKLFVLDTLSTVLSELSVGAE